MEKFDIRFTHLGLFVRDIERMAEFYQDLLGFTQTDRGHLGDKELIFLSRDPAEHHQIVFVSGLTQAPVEEVVNQISFRTGSLEELLSFAGMLQRVGVDDLRPINHGNAWSVYFRDPEGNRLEVYVSSPWYISQPCREVLDITKSAEAIFDETESWCRTQPGFAPAEVFKSRIAEKMAGASQ